MCRVNQGNRRRDVSQASHKLDEPTYLCRHSVPNIISVLFHRGHLVFNFRGIKYTKCYDVIWRGGSSAQSKFSIWCTVMAQSHLFREHPFNLRGGGGVRSRNLFVPFGAPCKLFSRHIRDRKLFSFQFRDRKLFFQKQKHSTPPPPSSYMDGP